MCAGPIFWNKFYVSNHFQIQNSKPFVNLKPSESYIGISGFTFIIIIKRNYQSFPGQWSYLRAFRPMMISLFRSAPRVPPWYDPWRSVTSHTQSWPPYFRTLNWSVGFAVCCPRRGGNPIGTPSWGNSGVAAATTPSAFAPCAVPRTPGHMENA